MVEVVAHRGAAALAPENTLAGFRLAVELGADCTECDVHLTRDGRPVVIHDPTVDRTTDGTGAVAEMSFEEVRALDAGQGERVPTLGEVLDVVRGHLRLEVELKGEGVVQAAVDAVVCAGMAADVVFTGFELDRLCAVKAMDPALHTAALFYAPPRDSARWGAAIGAEAVHVNYRHLTLGMVELAHERGLRVGAWNPDDESGWRAMLALGTDVLCTNRPDALIEALRRWA